MVVVRPLLGTPVTPNHLTVMRLAFGLSAAGSLAIGGAPFDQAACVLFMLSMLMDRADGDLARLTGLTSPEGHKLDLWADSICNALIFVGLGVGLRDSGWGPWAIPMGVVAGASVALVLFLVLRLEEMEGDRAGELGGFAGFDPDDAMLAVPILILFGFQEEILLAACVGASAFALMFVLLFLRRRRAAAS